MYLPFVSTSRRKRRTTAMGMRAGDEAAGGAGGRALDDDAGGGGRDEALALPRQTEVGFCVGGVNLDNRVDVRTGRAVERVVVKSGESGQRGRRHWREPPLRPFHAAAGGQVAAAGGAGAAVVVAPAAAGGVRGGGGCVRRGGRLREGERWRVERFFHHPTTSPCSPACCCSVHATHQTPLLLTSGGGGATARRGIVARVFSLLQSLVGGSHTRQHLRQHTDARWDGARCGTRPSEARKKTTKGCVGDHNANSFFLCSHSNARRTPASKGLHTHSPVSLSPSHTHTHTHTHANHGHPRRPGRRARRRAVDAPRPPVPPRRARLLEAGECVRVDGLVCVH